MPANKHHHRSGPLKQSNKKNKRSKASKRSQSRLAGGKIETSSGSGRRSSFKSNIAQIQQTKADRRHHQQQKRKAKRDEVLRKRRGIAATGGTAGAGDASTAVVTTTTANGTVTVTPTMIHGDGPSPPRVVGIINLGERRTRTSRRRNDGSNENVNDDDDMEHKVRDLILQEADWTSRNNNDTSLSLSSNVVTAKFDKHKKDGYLTVLTTSLLSSSSSSNNNDNDDIDHDDDDHDDAVFAALDLCRVCDIILFVIDADAEEHAASHPNDILGMSIGNDDHDDDDHRSIGTKRSKTTTTTTTTTQNDFDHLISECGDRILSAVKSQGLPEVITVLAKTSSSGGVNHGSTVHNDDDDDHMTTHSTKSVKSIRRSNLKRSMDVKKYISRFATTEFGANNDKVMEVNVSSMGTSTNQVVGNDDNSDGGDAEMDTHDGTEGVVASTSTTAPISVTNPALHAQRVLASTLVRTLCTTSASPSNWVSNLPRSFLVAEKSAYNPEKETLDMTGYIRGMTPFDVNALVHVPGLGTYACRSVRATKCPLSVLRRKKNNNKKKTPSQADVTMTNEDESTSEQDSPFDVIESDPMKRESLERFATPDALEGEQNLVGFDEADEEFNDHDMQDAGDEQRNDDGGGAGFARPAGWSDYQSAWLDAVDANDVDQDDFDHGELAKELNTKSSAASVAPKGMDLDDANDVTPEERRALVEQRKKQQQEHQEFPDEVQVDDDERARDRFARYRSLKSFKKSYWDPKENLPESYASVYNFSSFKTTQRTVMAEMRDLIKASDECNGIFWNGKFRPKIDPSNTQMDEDSDDEDDDDFLEGCIPSGSYVTITLEGVKRSDYDIRPCGPVMTAVSLLPHENKASVLHMGLSSCKDASSTVPVKSKDNLIFRCGWRTWTARPVFSQNNLNCDKHKFERYMPEESFFAASVFGPVTYTPCPVLVFRELDGKKELIASGSMIGADADRIVVKRIILTGYPVRVHKRFATVKYMFHDPEDVKWFKPAGLTTKHGLNGKIEESVGEHGTMKCLFNAPIKQHDTVCLCLYKRVFPKLYTSRELEVHDGRTVRTTVGSKDLIVK